MRTVNKPEDKHPPTRTGLRGIITPRNIVIIAAPLTFVGAIIFFLVPISTQEVKQNVLHYSTDSQNDSSLELGTEKVSQEGENGLSFTTYRHTQTMFDRFFRKDNVTREELSVKVQKEPTNKLVQKGVRKWQYMMCSNGTYRFYTDEQFKETNTGFTSKSPDYCAENKQGKKVSLADTAAGTNRSTPPAYTPSTYNSYTPYNSGSSAYSVKPYDTSPSSTTVPTVEGRKQDPAARQQCMNNYNSAVAQLRMSGAAGSSAMEQVQSLHRQCLSRAGY